MENKQRRFFKKRSGWGDFEKKKPMSGFRKMRWLNLGHGLLRTPDTSPRCPYLQALSLGRKPWIITLGRWLWYGEKSTGLVLLCDPEQVAGPLWAPVSPSVKGGCVYPSHRVALRTV